MARRRPTLRVFMTYLTRTDWRVTATIRAPASRSLRVPGGVTRRQRTEERPELIGGVPNDRTGIAAALGDHQRRTRVRREVDRHRLRALGAVTRSVLHGHRTRVHDYVIEGMGG